MAKLKATGKPFNDHQYVYAEPDDPFWKKKGYVEVEDEELEVDLDDMTVAQLEQFVEDYELEVDLSKAKTKAAKVKAIEAAVEEANAEVDADDEDNLDDSTPDEDEDAG
jgi:hypothetical protein